MAPETTKIKSGMVRLAPDIHQIVHDRVAINGRTIQDEVNRTLRSAFVAEANAPLVGNGLGRGTIAVISAPKKKLARR